MKTKKIIVLLTTMCMLFGLVACGESADTQNDDGQVTVDEKDVSDASNEKNEVETYDEITEEVVRNHAVTDASEFEYSPDYDSQDSAGIMISNYLGTDTIVVIPEEIDGKAVTSIARIFMNDSSVQGVLIPSGVKWMDGIFTNNKNIEVVIAEGVEVLGEGAFVNCEKLHTIILGESLKEINISAFGFSPALKELYIPKSVETIPPYALSGISEELTIKGESGSYIETYCNEYGINFEAVD